MKTRNSPKDLMDDMEAIQSFFSTFKVNENDTGSARIELSDHNQRYILTRLYFEYPGLVTVPQDSGIALIHNFTIVSDSYIKRLKEKRHNQRIALWGFIAGVVAAITGIFSMMKDIIDLY